MQLVTSYQVHCTVLSIIVQIDRDLLKQQLNHSVLNRCAHTHAHTHTPV